MCTAILICVLSAAEAVVELKPLSGEAVTGSLVEFSGQKVTVKTQEGPVSLAIDRVALLAVKGRQAQPAAATRVWVELADGSSVAAKDYAAGDGFATITPVEGKALELPARDVRSVRFQTPDGALAREWARILGIEADGDLLVVRKDETLDYHAGVIRNVTEGAVQFELDKEILPVKRAKVYGLRYHQAGARELPSPLGWLTDTAGSRWAVRSVALDGQKLQWTTLVGLEAQADLAALVQIDFSQDKIVYLSDLAAESTKWTPYFGTGKELPSAAKFFGPRQNRGLAPGPLQLGGTSYEKGLALHSRTELVYRLQGPFRRLLATAGIDDRVRPRGKVKLVIRGDDRTLLDISLTGADPARPIDLDLTGIQRLTILVDYGEDLDVADHLDLCEARIVK